MKQPVKRLPEAHAAQPTTHVEPERLRAAARLLLDSGDITPDGARRLEQIADSQ